MTDENKLEHQELGAARLVDDSDEALTARRSAVRSFGRTMRRRVVRRCFHHQEKSHEREDRAQEQQRRVDELSDEASTGRRSAAVRFALFYVVGVAGYAFGRLGTNLDLPLP
jgi:hypothetical protein